MEQKLNQIVVGFDLSSSSKAALEAAAKLAERTKAGIRIVTAVRGAFHLTVLEQLRRGIDEDLQESETWKESELLARIEQSVRFAATQLDTRGVPLEFDVAKTSPPTAIIGGAEAGNAEMIVVGARGKQTSTRERVGVTAQQVLRRSALPVWVVNPLCQSFPPRRIVCAVDFSEASQCAFEWALQFARLADAVLTVLHVVPRPDLSRFIDYWSYPRDLEELSRQGAQQDMDEFLAPFDVRDLKLSQWLLHGLPADQITNFLKDDQADLLAIGTLGGGAIRGMLFGGTAERVIRSATCSVLAVKPDSFSLR